MKVMIIGIEPHWRSGILELAESIGEFDVTFPDIPLNAGPESMNDRDDAASPPPASLPFPPPATIISFLNRLQAPRVESSLAEAGYHVISMGPAFRFHPLIPLLIPEVNPDHFKLADEQRGWKGSMVALPHPLLFPLILLGGIIRDICDITMVSAVWFIPSSIHLPTLSRWGDTSPPLQTLEQQMSRELARIFGWITGQAVAEYPVECQFLLIESHAMPVLTLDLTFHVHPPLDHKTLVNRLNRVHYPEYLATMKSHCPPPFYPLDPHVGTPDFASPVSERIRIASYRVYPAALQMVCQFDPVRRWFVSALAVTEMLNRLRMPHPPR